jgi:hypothetical protein
VGNSELSGVSARGYENGITAAEYVFILLTFEEDSVKLTGAGHSIGLTAVGKILIIRRLDRTHEYYIKKFIFCEEYFENNNKNK